MHTIEINTSQNVNISYKTASVIERIFAFLVDQAIIISLCIILYYVLSTFDIKTEKEFYDINAIYILTIFPILFFYRLAFEYFNNGQTPGKKIFHLKVMDISGKRPTLGAYIIRWLLSLLEFFLFMGSPAILSIMFTNKNQRIGDIAANTCVIVNKPLLMPRHITDRRFMPDYEVMFPMASLLNNTQAEFMNTILTNRNINHRNNEIMNLASKVKSTLNIVDDFDLKPRDFLEKIINDYAFLYWEEEQKGQIKELQKEIYELLE